MRRRASSAGRDNAAARRHDSRRIPAAKGAALSAWATALAIRLSRERRAWGHGAAARRACALARPAALGPTIEPLVLGEGETLRAIAAGEAAFGGETVALDGESPFAIAPPSPAWRDAAHSFAWLDHLAVAEPADRAILCAWVFDWLRRHGDGSGPGWTPAIAGRRAGRLAAAASTLADAADPRARRRLARAMRAHALFLAARWRFAESPGDRVTAAAGLALSALADQRGERLRARGIAALGAAAEAAIDSGGGVASRSPDDLADVFAALAWTAHALAEAGALLDPRHAAALRHAGPVLRALRLGDGSLARFHGGRGGGEAELDQALALAGSLARGPRREEAMGYARLSAGGLVALIDVASPPPGPRAAASALGIEISAGRRLMTGAIGCGAALGGEWAVAARATAAYCAVEVDGASSARLEPESALTRLNGRGLAAAARDVRFERLRDENGQWLRASHDGYRERFGLVATRRLNLARDGAALIGEDSVEAPDLEARLRFDRAAREGVLPFVVRFHLPAGVEAAMIGEDRARLTLGDGVSWILTAVGNPLRLEDSVWIAPGAAVPAPARQLVILGVARAYWGRVGWRFDRVPAQAGARRGASVGAV